MNEPGYNTSTPNADSRNFRHDDESAEDILRTWNPITQKWLSMSC